MRHKVDIERLQPFGVELAVDGDGEIDLHNFADFVAHESTEARLRLLWRASETGKLTIRKSLPNKKFRLEVIKDVSWVFEGVRNLQFGPRDPEMPKSEDDTLNFFEVRRESLGIKSRFVFQGGVEIQFVAESTYVETA